MIININQPGVQHFETKLKTMFHQRLHRCSPLVPIGSSLDNGWSPAKPWSWEGTCVSSAHGQNGWDVQLRFVKTVGGHPMAMSQKWLNNPHEPQNSWMKLDVHPANTMQIPCKYHGFIIVSLCFIPLFLAHLQNGGSLWEKRWSTMGYGMGCHGVPWNPRMWEESLTNLGFLWTPNWTFSWPATAALVPALPLRFSLVFLQNYSCLSVYHGLSVLSHLWMGNWWCLFLFNRDSEKRAGSTRAHLGLQFGVQASLRRRCEAFTCDVLWVACLHRRVDPKVIHVSKAKTGTTFPHLPFWWAETRNHQFNLDGLWHCFANILAILMGKTNSKWRRRYLSITCCVVQIFGRYARISASALFKKGEIWDTPSSSHSHVVMMG